jgi:hypothetical protein
VGFVAGVAIAGLALSGPVAVAPAATQVTIVVSTSCTIDQAVQFADGTANLGCSNLAPTGNTLIQVPSGTFKPSATLAITGAQVEIDGAGAAATTIDATQAQATAITVAASSQVTLKGLTLTGGGNPAFGSGNGADGGGVANAGVLTIDSCTITKNVTQPGKVPNTGSATGFSGGNGAGIYNSGAGSLTVTNSTISDNTAGAGGNGTVSGGAGGAGGSGGGIYNGGSGPVSISNSTITGNAAGAGGAGGGLNRGIDTPSAGYNGGNGGSGGGIDNASGGRLTIDGATISGNTAGAGGTGGTAPEDIVTVGAQQAGAGGTGGHGGSGGGIENAGQTATITDSTVSGNVAGSGGAGGTGGQALGAGGTAVGGNGGNGGDAGNGGGVDSSATLSLLNVTVAGNQTLTGGAAGVGGTGSSGGNGSSGNAGVDGTGGGVIQSTGNQATLTDATVAGNRTVAVGAGIVQSAGGTILETDSIVASNLGGSATRNCTGTLVDGGGNVVFGDTRCPGTSGDPKLGVLAANGGPTQTMALGAGSAAIDTVAACPIGHDERGISRPQGRACDAGAYESAPPAIAAPSGTGNSTSTATVTATVNPNLSGKDTTVAVSYGPTTAYGATTAAKDIGNGSSGVAVSFPITGLSPGTTYHFAVVATNGDGTSTSGDGTFATTPPAAATITSTSASGDVLTIGISCSGGSPGDHCSGPIKLTSHVTTQGRNTVAVAASTAKKRHKKKHRKPAPKKVTTQQTVGTGTYSVSTGQTATVAVTLNRTGQRLLSQFYKLPVTVTLGGSSTARRTASLQYSVIHSPISFTFSFSRSSTSVQELMVSAVPAGGTVTVMCRGGGCPFDRRVLKPKRGRVDVARQFKHKHLRPKASLELRITARNEVGKVAVFTIRSGKQPKLVESCLPPGARSPSRCRR